MKAKKLELVEGPVKYTCTGCYFYEHCTEAGAILSMGCSENTIWKLIKEWVPATPENCTIGCTTRIAGRSSSRKVIGRYENLAWVALGSLTNTFNLEHLEVLKEE
jgi:hypothetical protein